MRKVSNSFFRNRIEDHFEDLDLDVTCRKRKQAYAIYWADDDAPLARLRPTGQDDEVEVYWWSEERWQQVGEFGTVLPLDEALEYVTDDSEDLFFEPDTSVEKFWRTPGRGQVNAHFAEIARSLHAHIALSALLGGAAGGVYPGPAGGLACGVGAGMLFSTASAVLRGGWRGLLLDAVVVGLPASLVAAAAGTIGGGVSGALAGGVWGCLAGLLTGGLCALLVFGSRWLAWLIGFSAGLTLATWLVGLVHLREHFVGLALVALIASVAGRLYATLAGGYLDAVEPIIASSNGPTPRATDGAQQGVS